MDEKEEMEVTEEKPTTTLEDPPSNNEEEEAEVKEEIMEGEATDEKENNPDSSLETSEVEGKQTADPTATETNTPSPTSGDSDLSLTFKDFVDLQIRLVLMPYIEEEGKGAVVASYADDKRFEGLVLESIQGAEPQALQTADFTDILGSLRQHPAPITLIFQASAESSDEKLIVDVETSRKSDLYEEKKDDDGDAKQSTPSNSQDQPLQEELATPKVTNSQHIAKSFKDTISAAGVPKPSYFQKRKTTPSREHTQSLNSVLDDHRTQNDDNNNSEGNGSTLSSGMYALSAWGMKMKAQAEKHLATAKAAQQQQPPQKQPTKETSKPQLPCDMYIQSNLGTYFPISKHSQTNRPLHLQSVTASALYCIRKSATEPCPREIIHKGNPVQYSFQWYQSCAKIKNSRDRFPISPSALYKKSTFADEAMDESTQNSRHSRLYSSEDSVISSCSSWSSSSSDSSLSESTYSYSTAGATTNTRTSASKDTTIATKGLYTWIPLEGATKASFQPNATLVGKRLRCVVTMRAATASSSDDDSSTDAKDAGVASKLHGNDLEDSLETIVCDLAVPIQADMNLFNGARQALGVKGSASFANLVGRGSLATKSFRVEIGSTRQVVLYTPPSSNNNPKPQRRLVNVNKVFVYCRSREKEQQDQDYVLLNDVPLFQVTAKASSVNSKYVDLLFPSIPPIGDANTATHQFLSEYCGFDPSSDSEPSIPSLQLEARNRMTRESILLALGISNFRGKASQLDHQKVLFRDDEPILRKAKNPNEPASELSIDPCVEKKPQGEQDFQSRDQESLEGEQLKRQVVAGNLSLSPCPPSSVIGNSRAVLSPISCQLTAEETNPRLSEHTAGPLIPLNLPSESEANLTRMKELEREMEMLRAKLVRKDKIVNELQQHVQGVEVAHQKTKNTLATTRKDLKQSRDDGERVQISKRHIERSLQSQQENTQRLEAKHKEFVHGLEQNISNRDDKIAELEKLNRALQNEKAILGATVEARESKLVKLEQLQISNSELSQKVAAQGTLEARLEEANKKHERLQQDLEIRKEAEAECRKELEASKTTIQTLQKRMQGEKEKASSCQNQMDVIQKKNQQLKGERNSYKQKNESLSKEVARLCRGGKNIRDIEKVLSDHESLLQEVELLRIQKRKALEDAHKYRVSYEQAKAAEEVLSLKPDERETRRILERTAELERLLAEMTDYVSAKQMQLDTMKEVNEELQREIHSLAQANLRRDEV